MNIILTSFIFKINYEITNQCYCNLFYLKKFYLLVIELATKDLSCRVHPKQNSNQICSHQILFSCDQLIRSLNSDQIEIW